MKKIINFINKNKLIILTIIFTLIVIKGGVDASTSIAGTNVTYKDNYSLGATTVQAAVDKLCSKVSNIDTRVTNLESKRCYTYTGTIDSSGYVTVQHNLNIQGNYYPVAQVGYNARAFIIYALNSITANSYRIGIATVDGYVVAPAVGSTATIYWCY